MHGVQPTTRAARPAGRNHHSGYRRGVCPRGARLGARLAGDGSSDVVFGARRFDDDGGYTLALTALMLVPLMFFVAIAIDLGAWLAQAARVQRAADAAAMAGVVWMPEATTAQAAATAAARANGYTTAGGVTVSPGPGSQETDYQVTISAPAPRFFSQVVGLKNFTIARTAVARYNNPIPLGSPVNQFGNDPTGCNRNQPALGCGSNPMVWSAVNGPFAGRAAGDPYGAKCNGNGDNGYVGNSTCVVAGNANGAQNPSFDPDGYSFAVDVGPTDVGKTLTLEIYDAAQIERNPSECGLSGSDITAFFHCQAGDWSSSFGVAPAPLEVTLYQNDGFASTVTYPGIQPATGAPQGAPSGSTAAGECRLYVRANADPTIYKNTWVPVCKFTAAKAGIYPFRVRSSGGPATAKTGDKPAGTPNPITDYSGATVPDTGSGINAFSFRLRGGASTTTTRVYGLDNLSVYTNTPGATARFYLAEVAETHAGKKLRIDLFDPGDGTGTNQFTLQVLGPASGAPATVPGSGPNPPPPGMYPCKYNATASATYGPATPNQSNDCTITTKLSSQVDDGIYQDKWLRVEVAIPSTYSCPMVGTVKDCWWTIKYSFGSGGDPYDRTVWSMAVVGDPVHLIQ
jgi:hypothetical protein